MSQESCRRTCLLSGYPLHSHSACKTRICQRRRGGGLPWMLKVSFKRRNIEVQLRLFQHRRCVQMQWVTGQWLKGSGNAENAQNVKARLSSNAQRAMFICASTRTITAFVNSTSKGQRVQFSPLDDLSKCEKSGHRLFV